MMRNTSPVGWIPLLLLKIVQNQSFKAFIISGFLVAIPIAAICIGLDTLYFGGDKVTITSYNFMNVNLVEGLSKYCLFLSL